MALWLIDWLKLRKFAVLKEQAQKNQKADFRRFNSVFGLSPSGNIENI
jgi:hypothetical protein